MLKDVSWNEYLAAAAIVTAGYYLVIGVKYYREDLKELLSGKLKLKPAVLHAGSSPAVPQPDPEVPEDLGAIVADLRYAVLDKAGKTLNKSELLTLIRERLGNYSGLQKPAYRLALNNNIILNAREICGIVFSESELNAAWDSES